MTNLAEELHKPIKRKFKKRRSLVNGIDRIWAADLVDMQAFSKFNRGVRERKSDKMWVDNGKECFNKEVKNDRFIFNRK